MLFELYTGKPPIRDTTQLKILKKIINGEINLAGIETASAEF